VPLALQKPLGVNRSHTSRACGRNGLPIDVILHVAAGKDAGNIGLGAIVGQNVAVRIQFQLTNENPMIYVGFEGGLHL